MRVHHPDTDQKAEVRVFLNGSTDPCEEFEMNFDEATSNISECFISVEPGDEIMVRGTFEGTMLHGEFDLVCDGSFCKNSIMDRKDHSVKHRSHNFEFRRVLTNPTPDGWKSKTERPKDTWEGILFVKKIDEDILKDLWEYETQVDAADMPGVGSIEVVASINQDTRDTYFNKNWDPSIGYWKQRGRTIVRKPGIAPEYELGITLGDTKVSTKRSFRHKRHWEGTRYGPKPWARFIFYYRSQEAIEAAGCLPRLPEEERCLNPDHCGNFATIDPQTEETHKDAGGADDCASPGTVSRSRDAFCKDPRPLDGREAEKSIGEQQQGVKKNVHTKAAKRLGGTLDLTKGRLTGTGSDDLRTNSLEGTSATGPGSVSSIAAETRTSEPQPGAKSHLQQENVYAGVQSLKPSENGVSLQGAIPPTTHENDMRDKEESRSFADWNMDNTDAVIPDDLFGSEEETTSLDRHRTPTLVSRRTSSRLAEQRQGLSASSPTDGHDQDSKGEPHQGPDRIPDIDRVPSVYTIRGSITPAGIGSFALHDLFKKNQPYQHQAQAEQEFYRRTSQVAKQDTDGLYYTYESYRNRQLQLPAQQRQHRSEQESLPGLSDAASTKLVQNAPERRSKQAEQEVTQALAGSTQPHEPKDNPISDNPSTVSHSSKRPASSMTPSQTESPARRRRKDKVDTERAELEKRLADIQQNRKNHAARKTALQEERAERIAKQKREEDARQREVEELRRQVEEEEKRAAEEEDEIRALEAEKDKWDDEADIESDGDELFGESEQ